MSRENLDLALLMYELFNRRDLDAMLALMHDEVEIESRLVAMEGSYHHAREGPGSCTWRCQQLACRRDVLATDQVARRNVHLVAKLCNGSRGPRSH